MSNKETVTISREQFRAAAASASQAAMENVEKLGKDTGKDVSPIMSLTVLMAGMKTTSLLEETLFTLETPTTNAQ